MTSGTQLIGISVEDLGLWLGSGASDDGLFRPLGTPLVLDVRAQILHDERGRAVGQVVVARDVSELHQQRQRLAEANGRLRVQLATIEQLRASLAEQAVRDDLTGLFNRRHLLAVLDRELAAARRTGAPLSVVIVDVDHFKAVNDSLGHGVGDELLAALAHAMAGCARESDLVARHGGEEFVAVLPGTDAAGGTTWAERMLQACARVHVEADAGRAQPTVSAGVAVWPDDGGDAAALLRAADLALYAAKASGRNAVRVALREVSAGDL